MRLFFLLCGMWLGLTASPATAETAQYPNTISCKSVTNIFLLMHMWQYYSEAEQADALVYLIYTRRACTAYRSLHPNISAGTPIAAFEIDAHGVTLMVDLVAIPSLDETEYIISSQLKQ